MENWFLFCCCAKVGLWRNGVICYMILHIMLICFAPENYDDRIMFARKKCFVKWKGTKIRNGKCNLKLIMANVCYQLDAIIKGCSLNFTIISNANNSYVCSESEKKFPTMKIIYNNKFYMVFSEILNTKKICMHLN